ncbi:MAG: hypothetical protein GSR74_02680 [Desulfurococcales archaeon]|nr:hypothetical protein [Desulfurococcales archaeon]
MVTGRIMSLPEDFKESLVKKLSDEAKKSLSEAKGRIELQYQQCGEKLESRAENLVKDFASALSS